MAAKLVLMIKSCRAERTNLICSLSVAHVKWEYRRLFGFFRRLVKCASMKEEADCQSPSPWYWGI